MVTAAFMVASTPLGLLRLFDRFDVLARQAALISVVRLAGCAAAFALHAPMEGFLAAWAAGTLAGFGYLVFAAGSELSSRRLLQGFTWRGPLASGLPGAWRFAFATNFSATVEVGFTHVVTLAVGALIGPAQAALWRIGRQVADAMAKPARLLVPALYPELARIRTASGPAAMARLARQVGLVAGGAGVVLMLATLLAGGPLLGLLMGREFAAAAPLMSWQVAAAVVGIIALPLEPMLVSIGRPGEVLRVRIVVCAAYLALLVPVVQRFGAVGAAVLLLAAAAALAVGMLWRLARSLPAAAASPHAAGAEP
jgi:O-antigen/teichoic acid export membrane protein